MARRRFYTDSKGRIRPITPKKHFRRRRSYVLKTVPYQRGRSHASVDKKREALPPGERISSSGNVYWETRKNRTDRPGRKV